MYIFPEDVTQYYLVAVNLVLNPAFVVKKKKNYSPHLTWANQQNVHLKSAGTDGIYLQKRHNNSCSHLSVLRLHSNMPTLHFGG